MLRMLAFLAPLPIAVLACAVLLPPLLNHAHAASETYSVDTTDDDPALMTCDVAPNDCSLRGAITLANTTEDQDTIELANGALYLLDEPGALDNANLTGDLDINESTIVEGNAATIDAGGIDRVIEIYPAGMFGQVVINDLTIRGGITDRGAGLNVGSGDVTLDNVIITDNLASLEGGGVYVYGGADLAVTNSVLDDNNADELGGGLFRADGDGALYITDGEVTDNETGGQGGGLFIGLSSEASLLRVEVRGNNASEDGGGLYAPAQGISISSSVFADNHARTGGAMRVLGRVDVIETTIQQNTASLVFGSGGGIAAGQAVITDSTISGNSANRGGGIDASQVALSFSTIDGNSAADDGGGIANTGELAIDHSAITGNTAGDKGGGLLTGGGASEITNSTIAGNAADVGGGIWKGLAVPVALPQGGPPPGPLTLTHVTVAGNTGATAANVFNSGSQGPVETRASIFAQPTGGPNCNTALDSLDFNVEDANDCGLDQLGDQPNADPQLQPLSNNGGGTNTSALGINSDAIDAVMSGCPPPTDDQRGPSGHRPQGLACDAGAFESPFSSVVTPSPTTSPTPVTADKFWGDNDCGADVDPDDAIALLEFTTDVGVQPLSCFPSIGQEVNVDGEDRQWGDSNCDGIPGPGDALDILKVEAGIAVTVSPACPHINDEVTVSG